MEGQKANTPKIESYVWKESYESWSVVGGKELQAQFTDEYPGIYPR